MKTTFNPDIAHLNQPYSTETFKISAAHLARVVEQASLPLYFDKLLFGIRGGIVVNRTGTWQKELVIQEMIPNHESFCCTIGVWDFKNHQLAAFQGSTVPHQYWINQQKNNPDRGIANHLAIGLYDYRVGAHEPETREKEEGAFRQSRLQPVPVWRLLTKDATLVGGGASFDLSVVNDHIHSAQSETKPTGISFSSAGCQVVQGSHIPPNVPTGDYQQFRVLAGQSYQPNFLEVGDPYQYCLFHARHLKAIFEGFSETRYFHGSVHFHVRLIQERLMELNHLDENLIDKGHYNGATMQAVYQFQIENDLMADGIIKLKDLKALALNID